MSQDDTDFRVRPGRIRTTRAPKAKSIINQVLAAAKKAGENSGQTGGQRASGYGRSSFGRGHISFSRSRLFNSARRVVVKARVVRHQGKSFRSAPLTAHLSYLKREGVSRDGEKGVVFDAGSDRTDHAAFAERCQDDRHHFRFTVSPEDAGELTDIKAFTRDLARQMEADLGTRLDWVAVDHWNTDNPHVHLLVRGVDDAGADLVISRDYTATACARAPRIWSRSNSAPVPSRPSATPWSVRSTPSAGPASTSRSASPPRSWDTSTCGPRPPASMIRRSAA